MDNRHKLLMKKVKNLTLGPQHKASISLKNNNKHDEKHVKFTPVLTSKIEPISGWLDNK